MCMGQRFVPRVVSISNVVSFVLVVFREWHYGSVIALRGRIVHDR